MKGKAFEEERLVCLLTRLLIYLFSTTTALNRCVPAYITFYPELFIDPVLFKGRAYLTTGPL